MKLDWSHWISIAANVGLILGLVLVGLQLRQNASLARIQILSQDVSDERALEIGMFGEDGAVAWAKSIEDPASMTSAEIKVVDGWLISQVQGWLRWQLLEAEGLVPAGATEERIRSSADFYFGNRFAKRWWTHEATHGYDPNFIALVDSVLETIDDDTNARWLNDFKKEMGSG